MILNKLALLIVAALAAVNACDGDIFYNVQKPNGSNITVCFTSDCEANLAYGTLWQVDGNGESLFLGCGDFGCKATTTILNGGYAGYFYCGP